MRNRPYNDVKGEALLAFLGFVGFVMVIAMFAGV